jgi:hypothetical protein
MERRKKGRQNCCISSYLLLFNSEALACLLKDREPEDSIWYAKRRKEVVREEGNFSYEKTTVNCYQFLS